MSTQGRVISSYVVLNGMNQQYKTKVESNNSDLEQFASPTIVANDSGSKPTAGKLYNEAKRFNTKYDIIDLIQFD